MNILFTGVGRRVELVQAFRDAADCLGKELKIYGVDSSKTAPALFFCDYVRSICKMNETDYIEELLNICGNDKIDLVIPTIDTDLLRLAENKRRFDVINTNVLVSTPEMIRMCRDKKLTWQLFDVCGLKSPKPVDDWRSYMGPYPAFIKPKDGSSSIDAYKVLNRKQLKEYAERIKEPIIQPFIKGVEYTVDIFSDFYGNSIFITPRLRLDVRAGEVIKTEIDLDKKIIEECKRLNTMFKPCGPMTVQLIREEYTEDDHYIEINPRFGGGSPLSMKAGAKSAEVLLKMMDGETVDGMYHINDKTIYSRFTQNVSINDEKQIGIKGVIFDLDDTLYSEKEYVRSGYKAVAEYLGDEKLADMMWNYFECGKKAITECLRKIGREELEEICLKIYRTHKPDIRLYDGVKEIMDQLKRHNVKIGIITDGRPEEQRNKIEVLGLDTLVNDFVITDELGGPQFRKPCDIAFRIIQRRWKVPYETLIYVGDNCVKDFQASKQLGMKTLWFWNEEGLYQPCENILKHFYARNLGEVADVLFGKGCIL